MGDITRRGLAGLALAALPAGAGAADALAALNITENPFGPSAAARAALAKAVTHVEHYPHAEEAALMAVIAKANGVTPAHVAISTGALEPLAMMSSFWTKGGFQLAPALTYDTHISYAVRVGQQARRVAMAPDQQIDFAAMARSLGPDVQLSYVCNPNNPTGLLADRTALRSFCIHAARFAPVIVDEAFIDMSLDPAVESVVDLVREGHDVIVVGTFSKSYALAAVRIGYCIAQPERARAIRMLLAPSRNGPGLSAAAVSYRVVATDGYQDVRTRVFIGRAGTPRCHQHAASFKAKHQPLSVEARKRYVQVSGQALLAARRDKHVSKRSFEPALQAVTQYGQALRLACA